MLRQATDAGNFGSGPRSGFFHRTEYVQQLGLLGLFAGDIQQLAVVIGSVGDDVLAEVESRQVKQAFVDQIKGVEYAPGTAVTIGEWVDGLELVVPHSHTYQRV